MKVYLVGGAVRDKLLNYPSQEMDWVVVGARPEELEAQGYLPVGKDFPVFLHPETKEEYALARTERKVGPGYAGFEFHASPDVTLEQDLLRRDLTINAMAMDEHGQLIDPYGGLQDLEAKVLRHVSDAFREDPVRVLRVARFAARYHHLGFRVAPETMMLMREMVDSGEVDYLVAERVWREMQQALSEDNPEIFFQVLRECGALQRILPEIDNLFGVPQPARYHPEIDTGLHTMLSLQQAVKLSDKVRVRFAVLVHDLGKAATPKHVLPQHIGHEERGVPLIKGLCERIAVPNDCRDLALLVSKYHTHCHRAKELRPATVLRTLEALDAFRRPERFEEFLLCCEADARGRTGLEDRYYSQADHLRKALKMATQVSPAQVDASRFQGKAFGEELRRLRLEALQSLRKSKHST